jgi:predicted TIM-barrel fold metal-dependent hydrolase
MKKIDRRQALGLLGGTGATALLQGCCTHKYPVSTLMDAERFTPRYADMAPAGTRKHQLAPTPCIDVHAHFFNASDVPVRDYLKHCIAHDMPRAARKLLEAIAPVAGALAELAPTARAELNGLRLQLKSMDVLPTADRQAQIDREAEAELKRVSKGLEGLLRGSKFEYQYRELKRGESSAGDAAGDFELTSERIEQAARAGASPRGHAAAQADARPPGNHPDGVVAFIVCMCSLRWTNLRRFQKAYTTDTNAFGIDTVLGALVDFDHWLDCPPLSPHEDQIELHAVLSQLSGGYLRPLLAYNPKTDVLQSGLSLRRMLDSYQRSEFVGVKIYPPNGFKLAGNSDARLDTALKAFFDACASNDIPVMAHSSESMGRNDSYDGYGGPAGWAKLLAQYSRAAKVPIVNVAHFGGTAPDESPNNKWSTEFAQLMSTSGGARLYGDIGFWDELQFCTEEPGKCAAAVNRLEEAVKLNGGLAAERIMYGSDWLMLSRMKYWPEYPQRLAAALEGRLPLEKLFGQNALRCFPRLATP